MAWEAVHLDDLSLLDASPYKAVIFANTWLLEEHDKRVIREKVERDGREIFSYYAARIFGWENFAAEAVSVLLA